jgi:hypothetical protein
MAGWDVGDAESARVRRNVRISLAAGAWCYSVGKSRVAWWL